MFSLSFSYPECRSVCLLRSRVLLYLGPQQSVNAKAKLAVLTLLVANPCSSLHFFMFLEQLCFGDMSLKVV